MPTHAQPTPGGLPFVPPGATLTASGRQALSLVAQHLRARGITELLAPAYHCPTMLEPFQLEGVHVILVPVGDDLLLHPAALAAALGPDAGAPGSPTVGDAVTSSPLDDAVPGLDDAVPGLDDAVPGLDDAWPVIDPTAAGRGRLAAILHCETFGNRAGPDLAAVLAGAREAGHAVVVDETHSFLDGAGTAAGDYHVASLRKWLPLPDGAYVTGVPALQLGRRRCDDSVTAAGLRALREEGGGASAVAGSEGAGAPEDAAARWERAGELWERAEALVDAAPRPAAMSPEARDQLAAVDAGSLVRARAGAAARLRATLAEAGAEVLNRSACFVAVRVPDAERAARELAARGVHQPLRWERPRGLPRSVAWPAGILTVPLDRSGSGVVGGG